VRIGAFDVVAEVSLEALVAAELVLGAVLDVVVSAAVGAAVVPAAPEAVVPVVAGAAQSLLVALPPMLPAAIALPVAVQPAPGVELFIGVEVDWATATPPMASAATAARVVRVFFIWDSLGFDSCDSKK
jgi:hypothetical protein